MTNQSTSLFNQVEGQSTQDTSTNSNTTSNTSLEDTILASIKNDKGEQKYKDVSTALNALNESQKYIPQLKEQITAYEKRMAEMQAKMEELEERNRSIDELLAYQEKETSPAFDEGKVTELASKAAENYVAQAKAQEQAMINAKTVVRELKERFGTQATEEWFYKKGEEFGLNRQQLDDVCMANPKVALAMFGVVGSQPKQGNTINTSKINTSAIPSESEVTYIQPNRNTVMLGASTQEVVEEFRKGKEMVKEMAAKGITIEDMSDPKVYRQYFRGK